MRLFCFLWVLATAGLLAGCGATTESPAASPTTAAPAATATPAKTPLVTSADDIAACAQLEQAITAVSQLIGHTTEGITQALHPKELAEKTGTAQQSLIDSAKVIEIIPAQTPLAGPQHQLADALRQFAADFGRAKASTRKGDIAKASRQMVDEDALGKIQKSAKRIDDLCGA